MLHLVFLVLLTLVRVESTFYHNPGTIYIHENEDHEKQLHSFTPYCTVRTTCSHYYSYECSTWSCGWESCWWKYQTCYATRYYTCYPTYVCNYCSYSGDSRFFVSGTNYFYKKNCTDHGCGPTCTAANCNNAGNNYPVTITCWRSGYQTDGRNSMSFTVSITSNVAPTFYWYHGDPFNVYQSSNDGDWVNRMIASDSDAYIDNDYVRYRLIYGVNPSYIHGNTLFTFDTGNGYVYVSSDLRNEFSNIYELRACVYDRRDASTCDTLNITLHACYQTPNCTDQEDLTIHDTHGLYTGHGTTNTLYNQIFPQPGDQFPNFHNGWHQLNWAFTRNDFDNLNDPPVKINRYTGEIYIDRNISIFPSYPYEDFNMTVEVSNPSASCYNTTCDFFTRVWFTNWPIEIRSLPATTYLHEDTDAETLIHVVNMYDYNYHWEDNFTCELTDVSSNSGINEDNLFEVRQVSGGAYTYNSWRIYKLRCQDPDCGYLYDPRPFFCNQSIGCMNHNDTQEYYLTVTCWDGYNSTDVDVLTFRPIQNRAPYYTNLPKTITLDSDDVANLDIVYSMTYWDLENEKLYYNYTYIEDSTGTDPGFWLGTTEGNYYNNLGNISATVHFWNTTNSTFTIYICGHERRNMICDYLYIRVQEYCGPIPSCNGTTVTITDEFAVGGELFDISSTVPSPSNGGSYAGLSYAIAHSGNYFVVDSVTGSVTLNNDLPAVFPNKTYSVSAYVYDADACEYAQCTYTIHVTAVNNPLTVDNLDASVNIHEDTVAETSLFTVATSDTDQDQPVDCSIVSISPNESVPDHFILRETYSGSEVYEVHSKADPGFTSATLLYLVTIECDDDHGSTATGTLSVTIDENQTPTLTNLGSPSTVSIDPATQLLGDLVFIVNTSDTENDAIIFNCTVANSEIPFECNTTNSEAYIVLTRSLDIVDDDGVTYSIDVCISDAKHHHAACGSVQATLTSSRTYPYINNLPDTVTVAEDAAIGTSLFDLEFTDPDVGETHIFNLVAVNPNSSLFSLNWTTGEVFTSGSLDYETRSHYSLEFTIQDNYLTSVVSMFLYVNVTDVNEPPNLSSNTLSMNLTEGVLPGHELPLYLNVSDPDLEDTQQFSIISGTHASYFAINTTDGTLSLATEWDLESGLPSSTTLVIAYTDSAGLSSTIEISVEFTDLNDNPPTVSLSNAASTLNITALTTVIDDILTITCSDADVGDDGFCEFYIVGDGYGNELFTMDVSSKRSVGSSASLHLKTPVTYASDTTFVFTVGVSDDSGPDGNTVGVPVTVTYIASDPIPPTKPTSCTTCTARGKWLIAFLIMEAAIVAGLIGHVIWHFNFRYRKDKSKEEDEVIGTVIHSRNKSNPPPPSKFSAAATSKTQSKLSTGTTSKTKPSIRSMQSSSMKTNASTKQSSRQTTTPSVSGLYSTASLGQNKSRVSSDMVISNLDSSSSDDSDDSSDEEVTIPSRMKGAHAKGEIPNIGFQRHRYSGPGPTGPLGLPKPVYR